MAVDICKGKINLIDKEETKICKHFSRKCTRSHISTFTISNCYLWYIIDGEKDQNTQVLGQHIKIFKFSGFSLTLKKDVCDWLRQTLNPSGLKVSDPSKTELIHTSCRSESSNISLVVLDNDGKSLQHINSFVSDNRFGQVFILLYNMATDLQKYCFTVACVVLKERIFMQQIVVIFPSLDK